MPWKIALCDQRSIPIWHPCPCCCHAGVSATELTPRAPFAAAHSVMQQKSDTCTSNPPHTVAHSTMGRTFPCHGGHDEQPLSVCPPAHMPRPQRMTTLAACQLVIALLAASRQARPASTASSLVRGYPEPAQLDEAAGDYEPVDDGCASVSSVADTPAWQQRGQGLQSRNRPPITQEHPPRQRRLLRRVHRSRSRRFGSSRRTRTHVEPRRPSARLCGLPAFAPGHFLCGEMEPSSLSTKVEWAPSGTGGSSFHRNIMLPASILRQCALESPTGSLTSR